MKIEKRLEVTEVKMVTIGRKCDVCEKVSDEKYTPDDWHSFSHNHNEWGNDSVDSYEYHEVCSPECYVIKLKECVEELADYENARVGDFEIQFARRFVDYIRS